MIDKIEIHTADYRVKDITRSGLLLKQGNVDFATQETNEVDLFTDSLGVKVKGQKVFGGVKDFYTMDINGYGLMISFNPSKMSHPYHLLTDESILKANCEKVMDHVQKERGVLFDREAIKTTRIDLAKNRTMNQPIYQYGSFLSTLKAKRSKKQALYPDGYMTGSNQRKTIFYDKMKEQEIETDENVLRVELQIKSKAIVPMLKLNTLPYLYDAGFDYLNQKYSEHLVKDVLREPNDMPQPTQSDLFGYDGLLAGLKEWKKQGRNGGLQYLTMMSGGVIDIKNWERLMLDAGYHRSSVNRAMEQARRFMTTRLQTFRNVGQSVLDQQYKEIKTKFVA